MSTARTTSPRTTPTDLPTWAIQAEGAAPSAEHLAAMLATDDDAVDTAVIPRLAYRDAVEEAALPGRSAVTTIAEPADEIEHVVAPVGHNLRRRHASPESVAAIRRNLLAVACVVASVVVIGLAVGWLAGWIALAAYAVLVIGAAIAVRRANSRYTARHSRYTARHA